MDEYETGAYRWWHLSGRGPELDEAFRDRWFPTGVRVLDVGCGAGSEAAALSTSGAKVVGIDLSLRALSLAEHRATGASFVAGDATMLPFADSTFDAAIDRGCFHYLPALDRLRYAHGLVRVLKRDSPFLLRACLTSAGVRNLIDESTIESTFEGWSIDRIEQVSIPSDSRSMPALVCRLRSPS